MESMTSSPAPVAHWAPACQVTVPGRRPIRALAVASDGVQIAAMVGDELYLGLVAATSLPAPLLPTGVPTQPADSSGSVFRRGVEVDHFSVERHAPQQLAWSSAAEARFWLAAVDALVLYDTATGVVRRLPTAAPVTSVCLADAELVVGIGHKLCWADPANGNLRRVVEGHAREGSVWVVDSELRGRTTTIPLRIGSLDVISDGRVITGGDDGAVRLWSPGLASSELLLQQDGAILAARWLDDRSAVVASASGRLLAVDVKTGAIHWERVVRQAPVKLIRKDGHLRLVRCEPDDPELRGKAIPETPASTRAFAISSARRRVAGAWDGAWAEVVDIADGRTVARLEPPAEGDPITALAFVSGTRHLLAGTSEGRLALYVASS
jgi:hypothetical protein